MRAAIIGTGSIAREHLGALAQVPQAETVAVCDLSPTLAEATAERFSVPAFFTDFRELLTQARPQVVHIATPPPSHVALATACLQAGVHVLCEKPLAPDFAATQQLLQLAEARGVCLIENHNYRFNEPVRRILAARDAGAFGEITHVEVEGRAAIAGPHSRFADPNAPHPCLKMKGGAIADFLTHIAYLIVHFIGPHTAVRAAWEKRIASSPLPHDEFRALVRSARGTAFASFSALSQPEGFWLRVKGTQMEAETNLWEPPRLSQKRLRDGYGPLMTVVDGLSEAWQVGSSTVQGLALKLSGGPLAYDGLYALIAETYAALESGRELPVTPRDVAQTARLVSDFTSEECAL